MIGGNARANAGAWKETVVAAFCVSLSQGLGWEGSCHLVGIDCRSGRSSSGKVVLFYIMLPSGGNCF